MLGTPAQAQNYPWCAQYSGGALGGAMNCGLVSFQQCLATVSGIGGFCVRNTLYQPPAGPRSGAGIIRIESNSIDLNVAPVAPAQLCQFNKRAVVSEIHTSEVVIVRTVRSKVFVATALMKDRQVGKSGAEISCATARAGRRSPAKLLPWGGPSQQILPSYEPATAFCARSVVRC